MNMAIDESTRLLENCVDRRYSSGCNHNRSADAGYHTLNDKNHVVYINKDVPDYGIPFCLNDYSDLTLDELLPYILDPWWQKLRRNLLSLLCLIWLVTFATACLRSYLQYGHTSCNLLEKPTASNSINNILTSAATTLPTALAKVLAAEPPLGK